MAQRPVASWSGLSPVLHAPLSATRSVSGAGAGELGGAELPGRGDGPPAAAPAGPSYAVVIDTWVALDAVPWTRIAPFSTVVLSPGWSTVSDGASIGRNGTVITIITGVSACLPVSGSVASILNSFLPRTRSTASDHAPVLSADVCRVPPASSTVMVASGMDVPPSVYDV